MTTRQWEKCLFSLSTSGVHMSWHFSFWTKLLSYTCVRIISVQDGNKWHSRSNMLLVPFAGLKLDWNWLKNTVSAELLWEKNTVPTEKKKGTIFFDERGANRSTTDAVWKLWYLKIIIASPTRRTLSLQSFAIIQSVHVHNRMEMQDMARSADLKSRLIRLLFSQSEEYFSLTTIHPEQCFQPVSADQRTGPIWSLIFSKDEFFPSKK